MFLSETASPLNQPGCKHCHLVLCLDIVLSSVCQQKLDHSHTYYCNIIAIQTSNVSETRPFDMSVCLFTVFVDVDGQSIKQSRFVTSLYSHREKCPDRN